MFLSREGARDAASRNGDFFGFVHATLWAANCLEGRRLLGTCRLPPPEPRADDPVGRTRTRTSRGSAAVEADGLLLLGDWRGCEDRLRVALGSPPGPLGDIDARLLAALQACWQGRRDEADAHLARAEELFAEKSGFLTQ